MRSSLGKIKGVHCSLCHSLSKNNINKNKNKNKKRQINKSTKEQWGPSYQWMVEDQS